MSTHQFIVGFNHLVKGVQTTIFGQNFEQVVGQFTRLTDLLGNIAKAIQLGSARNSGVFQKALESSVLLDGLAKCVEVLLNSFKIVLTGSSSVKCSSITTFKTVKGDGSLIENVTWG